MRPQADVVIFSDVFQDLVSILKISVSVPLTNLAITLICLSFGSHSSVVFN